VHYYVLKEALLKDGPSALLHPQRIREAALAKLLIVTCNSPVPNPINSIPTLVHSGRLHRLRKQHICPLVRSAHGKILELGPGPGNQIHRYDPSLVDFIYGVDPNPRYADAIAAKVKKLDLQDKYKFLACCVEDSEILRLEGITEASLDTVLSIQVLCAVGDAKSVMREVWKLLKPGGSFVFWEHERNKDTTTAVVQGTS
jgi:ubiquinone/menaquinone biosynthesis C-methylase UbiE